ncbi:MAG: GTPase [Thermoguttaceae bacterium]
MDLDNTVRVILLTPPGRGAVATVRVEGRGACALVDSLFSAASGRPVAELAPDRPAFGRFRLADNVYDEVIVRRPAEDAVEIHCHGGGAVVQRMMDLLTAGGARPLSPRHWLEATHPSPIVAAARDQLARATTLRAAAVLLDQFHGALDRHLEEILVQLAGRDARAVTRIEGLLAVAPCGCHLATPWRVVVAGRPNVGKSSLVNSLVGYRRAMVHEEPGTTRDLVTATTALDGWPVELCDTAGLRDTEHPIERQGIQLALRRLESASLVLLVFDSASPWTRQDAELCRRFPLALPVFNKHDLVQNSPQLPPGLPRPVDRLPVSARHGQGIDELVAAISHRLVPHPPPPGGPVPFLNAHVDALQTAATALDRGDWSRAVEQVAHLLARPSTG